MHPTLNSIAETGQRLHRPLLPPNGFTQNLKEISQKMDTFIEIFVTWQIMSH